MRALKLFSLLLLVSQHLLAKSATQNWSWTLDHRQYSINFSPKNFSFESEYDKLSIPQKPCSQKAISEFKKKLQNLLESKKNHYSSTIPSNFSVIDFYSSDVGSFKVLPGTPLGLFLIDIKYEIQTLKSQAAVRCRN